MEAEHRWDGLLVFLPAPEMSCLVNDESNARFATLA